MSRRENDGDGSRNKNYALLEHALLRHHVPLLQVAPDEALLRQAATRVLDCIHQQVLLLASTASESSAGNDATAAPTTTTATNTVRRATDAAFAAVREAFAVLVTELGPGDAQVRHALLQMLSVAGVAENSDTRQLLLDLLPCVVAVTSLGSDDYGDDYGDTVTPHDADAILLVEQTLRFVLERDPTALLPVLGFLSQLSFFSLQQQRDSTTTSNNAALFLRTRVLDLAVTALATVSETELPALTRTILRHISTAQEAAAAWDALRHEWHLMPEQKQNDENGVLQLTAHIVVSSFFQGNNLNNSSMNHGELLATSYLKRLELLHTLDDDDDDTSVGNVLLLDLVVLLTLSLQPQYAESIDRIVDSWLWSRRRILLYPLFDALLELLAGDGGGGGGGSVQQHQRNNNLLYKRLAPALLRLAVFLLLAPARYSLCNNNNSNNVDTPSSFEATAAVHRFILNLHHCLDRERQAELVHSLLHLSEETAWSKSSSSISDTNNSTDEPFMATGRHNNKRKLVVAPESVKNSNGARFVAHQSVNALLKRLAETAPTALIRFKHELTRRLTCTTSTNNSDPASIQQLCSILASLVESDRCEGGGNGLDPSELMMLLQKLLFSGSVRGDWSRVVRGIVLATELIQKCCFCRRDKDCIQEWVLRLLLPATRRTVDPELGSPGLEFLKAWMRLDNSENNSSNKDAVFQHFKMILANTGLIQMLATYQTTKDNDAAAILGYSESPLELQSPAGKAREMLFCVNFFLRHTDMANPARWTHAAQWVFELVDTYLRMGREKATKSWRPDGWLMASLEFPAIALPFDATVKAQKSVVEWIKGNLCRFELSRGIQRVCGMPLEYADTILSSLDLRQLRLFQDSVFRFSLSVLIGITLSAAVLKNAFEHLRVLQNDGDKAFNGSDDLLRLIKLQIIKIYDLRAKSEEMDILLSSLDSALRRSSLRSKRATAGVSDDMSDVSTDVVLAADESVEHKRAILGIGGVTSKTFSLRTSIFTSQKNIGIDVLWEVLIDPIDQEATRNCLTALSVATKPDRDDSILAVFRLIDLKSNVLHHIISLVDTISPSLADDLVVTEAQFVHCLNEICFLLDTLPKLRRGYFALESRKIGLYEPYSHVSLSQVVLLGTSYIRVLVLILQHASRNRSVNANERMLSEPLTIDSCSKWFDFCPDIGCGLEMNEKSDAEAASPISRLFQFFSERLRVADNSLVADHLLEVLSILALQDDRVLLEKLIDLSWISLHTIYVHTGAGAVDLGRLPCTLSEATRRFGTNATSSDQQALRRVVDRTVAKFCHHGKYKISGLQHLRQGMLRHWGLLIGSTAGITHQRNQLLSMIAELGSLLESLGCSIGRKHEEEKKENETSSSRKNKSAQAPSIIGLEAATFPDYFELLIQIVVATAATLNPGRPGDSGFSPYHHLQESFALFRRLIELYQQHVAIFPRKSASFIANVSKDVLSVAVSQLQYCVDWRNTQPLLSVQEREAGKHDPGAIQFLQQLLDAVASHTAGAILTLCDFWQSREGAQVRLSRSTTLRFAAEKAARRMKDVSSAHNLAPPSFGAEYGKFESDDSLQQTKGFHQVKPAPGKVEKRRICPMPVNSAMGNKPTSFQQDPRRRQIDDADELLFGKEPDDDDSDDSFAAAGDWGDNSDDDVSESSLNLFSNAPLLRF